MISVCWSWMVASAIPGLPMITVSAGREMCMTLAWSIMTERVSSASAHDAAVTARRNMAGRRTNTLNVTGMANLRMAENLNKNGE